MQKKVTNVLLYAITSLILSVSMASTVFAANDPSIKGDLRGNIQQAMQQFIQQQTINQAMYLYDAVDGHLLKLTLDKLHDGIVKKGDFYVSCADFKDQKGRKIDVDFLVRSDDHKLIATQGLVHSVDGEKRKYHLEKL